MRNGKNHRRSLFFRKKLSNSLNKLEIEIFYSTLIFFDLCCSSSLLDDGSKSPFSDNKRGVGEKGLNINRLKRLRNILFKKLEKR
jgi:hypothetical protein